MNGWTKLFASIVTSSVWVQRDPVRLVWIAMLATCDSDGVVQGSIPGFASLARVSVEDMRDAVSILSAPDPDSRTPDHEGRRIEAIEGGWRLLNYATYRERAQDKDGSKAPAMRRYRARKRATESSGNALPLEVTRAPQVTQKREERRKKKETEETTTPPTPPAGAGGGPRAVRPNGLEGSLQAFAAAFNAIYERRCSPPVLTREKAERVKRLIALRGEEGLACLPLLAWAYDVQRGGLLEDGRPSPALRERLRQRVPSHLLHDGTRGGWDWSQVYEHADRLDLRLRNGWAWAVAERLGLARALEALGARR